jgi:FkbM family methyltransferase
MKRPAPMAGPVDQARLSGLETVVHLRRLKERARRSLPVPLFAAGRKTWRIVTGADRAIARRRRQFEELNVGNPSHRITLRKGITFAIDPRSRDACDPFCWRSPVETAEFDAFVQLARGRRAFVDVGALHGIFALAFCAMNPEGRALALDPSPFAADVIPASITLSGFKSRLTFLNIAADVEARDTLAVANARDGAMMRATPISEATGLVESDRLDVICDRAALRPDLLKIDVEGFDLNVLRGAASVLDARPAIMLEVHPWSMGRIGQDPDDLARLLLDRGYRLRTLDGTPPTPFSNRHRFHVICEPG